ncbi:LytR family transcriptional attenuator [Halanaerobium saccharolyticum]|uniref:LytR family transcriptional attenuator n=1 Tax=Halanaerobium saccharolyticum TaxID=43595 RepID=A0A4R6LU53_9FIRM|nr:LCP family protein [Halanaerobium saccharolyticum]TDO92211.1 LytR family transcriptional attenuator [Halanaerobium saccharolyticum]
MAEKNTQDNQKSKKKHKWIGVFLIALLLLFIGLAGYYLERDLEPVPDNQVEKSEDTAITSDMKTEKDKVATKQPAEKTESDAPPVEDEDNGMTSESYKKDTVKTDSGVEPKSDTADTEKTSVKESKSGIKNGSLDESDTAGQKEEVDQKDKEKKLETELNKGETDDTTAEDSSVETEEQTVTGDQSQETTPEAEDSGQTDLEQESDKNVEVEEEEVEMSAKPEKEEDITQEREKQLKSEGQINEKAGVERDEQVKDETQNDFARELEDPSLLDRILSILGLSESDFTQDLNILFVGLDSEESVAIGSVEADSIMLAKLRPGANKLLVKHINEDTKYKGQLLRKYHNGDIQSAVEEITATEIDYYVYLRYQGFEKVIDELGGVQITLKQEIRVPGLGLNLKEGNNLLSGKEALNFVRWRSSDSMARFERQKLLINAVLSKLKSNNILFNVKELYNTIVKSYNSIETDINPVLAAEIFNYIRENDKLKLEFIE